MTARFSSTLTRRSLLVSTAALLVTGATAARARTLSGGLPWQPGAANPPQPVRPGPWMFFTADEAALIEAAVDRLIPPDDRGPGGKDAGCAVYIDRQLAGPYGRGERWYMQGPWSPGLPTQGYQTRLTPAGMYRAAIKAIDAAVVRESRGGSFSKLAPADQDAFLQRLEKGDVALDGADGKAFFAQFLQNTLEGFWSDPIHGGNRDLVGWKLIGFPGARYDNTEFVARHGEKYPLPPVGIKGRVEWIRS
ncbi:MAG: gluconate 2-dehydrogenase subunit 3 family protein [Pseudomonadota bacterium]|nr:gluconate 2-dehydrogenase subunit 3 family protein [Pseudomonadota bacterium]